MENLIKALFYFLGVGREEICVEGTQKFFWKKARHLWNDGLIEKMAAYKHQGPKSEDMKPYQTLNYIDRAMHGLNQDYINRYNFALGLIYRWMVIAIEARKKDIVYRLAVSKERKQERNQKIEEDKQRTENRKSALATALEDFKSKNRDKIDAYKDYKDAVDSGNPPELEDDEEPPTEPLFDEKYFLYNWDDENPAIIIPMEVKDDVDNDWLLTADKKEDLILQYQGDQAEAQASASAPAGRR